MRAILFKKLPSINYKIGCYWFINQTKSLHAILQDLYSRVASIQEIFFNSNFCGHYSRAAPFQERPLLARVRYARKNSISNMYSLNVVVEFQSESTEIQQTFLQQQMYFIKYLLWLFEVEPSKIGHFQNLESVFYSHSTWSFGKSF